MSAGKQENRSHAVRGAETAVCIAERPVAGDWSFPGQYGWTEGLAIGASAEQAALPDRKTAISPVVASLGEVQPVLERLAFKIVPAMLAAAPQFTGTKNSVPLIPAGGESEARWWKRVSDQNDRTLGWGVNNPLLQVPSSYGPLFVSFTGFTAVAGKNSNPRDRFNMGRGPALEAAAGDTIHFELEFVSSPKFGRVGQIWRRASHQALQDLQLLQHGCSYILKKGESLKERAPAGESR